MANEGTATIVNDELQIEVFGTEGAYRAQNQALAFDHDFSATTVVTSQSTSTFATGDQVITGIFCTIGGNDVFIQIRFIEGTGYTLEWDINGTANSEAGSNPDSDSFSISRTNDLVSVKFEGVEKESLTVTGDVEFLSMRNAVTSAADTANATGVFNTFEVIGASLTDLTNTRIIFFNSSNFSWVTTDNIANVTGANIEFSGTNAVVYSANSEDFIAETPIGTPYCTNPP